MTVFWCAQELEAVRDALTPTLACAAAKIGDIEALEAIREMVRVFMSHHGNPVLSFSPLCGAFLTEHV